VRTKPLNPNSMAVIMENFRRYASDVANEQDIERVYLLQEGKIHEETTLSTLIEKRDCGEINTLELIDLINESAQHELDQLLLTEAQEEEEVAGPPAAIEPEQKQGLKYKAREKILNFVYSKVAAHLKATFGEDKKTVAPLDSNLKKAQVALKAGKKQEALKFLGTGALQGTIKGAKILFKGMIKIVQFFLGLVKKVGPLFKHPVVRVLIIGALCLVLFQAVGVAATVVAGAKVVNQATALATGKTAAGHAIGAAGKAAVKGAGAAIGITEEEEQLNEVEEIVDIASVLADMEIDTLGAAIIKLAAALEDQELFKATELDQMQLTLPAGREMPRLQALIRPDSPNVADTRELSRIVVQVSDEALSAEMSALSSMKDALVLLQKGEEIDEQFGGMTQATAAAMEAAKEAAIAACEQDPTHCLGANKLVASIDEVWSGTVNADLYNRMNQTAEGASQFIRHHMETGGVETVRGGTAAAAKLAAQASQS